MLMESLALAAYAFNPVNTILLDTVLLSFYVIGLISVFATRKVISMGDPMAASFF